jgi:hypothetical protein
MDRDRNHIEQEIASIVYYMNGGLNFRDAYALSESQMDSLATTIKKHYEKQNEAYEKAKKPR